MAGLVGHIGTTPFGPIAIGGAGGGGGGGTLNWVSGVCGQAGGPVAGGNTWTPAANVLNGKTSYMIVVNEVPEFSIGAAPAFSLAAATITRNFGNWVAGDTVVAFYQ